MLKQCTQCAATFEITSEDIAFYEKVSPEFNGKKELIPPPTLCPECRFQHRIAFRNEWKLYHRKCDLTKKQIVSVYSPDKALTVYTPNEWWSDRYDPLQYGRAIDMSRPFFEQYQALHTVVPKSAIQHANSENCDYTNYSHGNRNCYLVVGTGESQDCLYSYRIFRGENVVDSYDVVQSQWCYECRESSNMYMCFRCSNCHNCSDCFLCDSCIGCKDCFGCANVQNKQFYMYNQPFTETEYRKRVASLRSLQDKQMLRDVEQLHLRVPHRFGRVFDSEECRGDQLLQCQRCVDCYTWKFSQDCRFCALGERNRDCHDANFCDNCELQYNATNLEKNYRTFAGVLVWYCKEAIYCMNCFNSTHIFGCSGLKKQQYCILNKQYTKEEYEALVPKIIEKMRADGEWGEFFPVSMSPFGYNETVAQEYYPLSKEEVLKRGWKWHEEEESKDQYMGPPYVIPNNINDVEDDITKQILRCEVSGKPYKIIPQELKFYREMGIPIPRRCPDQRHKDRMALRNPRKLWNRECAKCRKPIATSYSPDRPEIVYCEACYLATVY